MKYPSLHFTVIYICIFGLGMCVPAAAMQAPVVIDHVPAAHARAVDTAATVTVSFDTDMNGASIEATTFVVNGSLSGPHPGTIDYVGATRTATFTPNWAYAPGEVVTVTLTTGIESAGAEKLAMPYSWSFTVASGPATGQFQFGPEIPIIGSSLCVGLGDFNGDNLPDIASVNYDNNTVTVITNSGDNTFAVDSAYDIGSSPRHVCIGDFNGDRALDMGVTMFPTNDVAVLLNLGDGTFAMQAPVPAGTGPRSILTLDADGDGDLDLATANQNAGAVSILINDGLGGFTFDSSYVWGDTIFYLGAADMDLDGSCDLVVSSSSADCAFVLLNLGTGVFAPPVRYEIAGNHPRGTAAADFDGDGFPDIVTANDYSADVSILYNLGDGTVGDETLFSTGSGPFTVISGDIDGDSDIDIVTANGGYGSNSVLKNAGDGTFSLDRIYNTSSWSTYNAALGDLDGDNDLDMAVSCITPPRIMVLYNRDLPAVDSASPAPHAKAVPVTDSIVVYFTAPIDQATVNDTTMVVRSQALGDISGTFTYMGQTVVFKPADPFLAGDEITVSLTKAISVFSSTPVNTANTWSFTTAVSGGVGDFKDAVDIGVDAHPRAVRAADFTNDGLIDLAVVSATTNSLTVLVNNGDMTFSPQTTVYVDRIPYALDAGDLDSDGDMDIVIASLGDHSISICYNLGDGTFESITNIPDGEKTSTVTIADYNGDGHLDIAAGKVYSDSIYVYFNDGSGTYPVSGIPWYAQGAPYTIISVDIDGDGDYDLVSANYSNYNYFTILFNNGAGEFGRRAIKEVFLYDAGIADSAHTIYAGDFNHDGLADLAMGNVWANNITVLINDGGGSFPVSTPYDITARPHAVCGGDFNADGHLDLACADQTIPGLVTVLENYGDGTFTYKNDYAAGDSVHHVAAADIDGDGDADIIGVNGLSDNISILINKDSMYVSAVSNPVEVAQGDSCLLGVNVSGDPDSIMLYYRLGGAIDWYDTMLVSPDTQFHCTIPTDPNGIRTTAYYFGIFQDDRAVTIPAVTPKRTPNYIRSLITEAPVPGLLGDVYQMVGFPHLLNPGHPDSIFLDDLGDYGNTRWRMGRWNPELEPEPGYEEFPDLDSLCRGDGFWLYTRVGMHLDAGGISAIPDTVIGDTAYSRYELKPGWNQIATPFGFPLLWTHRIAESDIESAIYTYAVTETDTSYVAVDTLKPYAGYFIKNSAASVRTLHLPYIHADLMPSEPAVAASPRPDFWQARLSIESGGVADISNVFGVRPDADAGRDRYDLSEPPLPPGRFVSLSFESQNDAGHSSLIAGDFRQPDSGWTFDLLIRGNVNTPVNIRLSDTTLLPPELCLVLENPATGKTYDLSRSGSVELPGVPNPDGVRYRLLVGSEDFIDGHTGTGEALPDTYRLFQNYPNPFNPDTRIAFELPAPSRVRLDIFNILGQRISTLVDRYLPAGRHEAVWDGRDDDNNSVASGIYFYRIQAGDFVAKRKMILLK